MIQLDPLYKTGAPRAPPHSCIILHVLYMALFILFRPFLVSWSLYFKSQFYRARFAFFQIRSALENWDGGTFKSSEYTDFSFFSFFSSLHEFPYHRYICSKFCNVI